VAFPGPDGDQRQTYYSSRAREPKFKGRPVDRGFKDAGPVSSRQPEAGDPKQTVAVVTLGVVLH
jgi:hypothetical protein